MDYRARTWQFIIHSPSILFQKKGFAGSLNKLGICENAEAIHRVILLNGYRQEKASKLRGEISVTNFQLI